MNLARAKSKAIKNRAAADGQTAIIRAWGGASASRNPLVPWKGDGGFCASVLQMHCLLVLYQIWHNTSYTKNSVIPKAQKSPPTAGLFTLRTTSTTA